MRIRDDYRSLSGPEKVAILMLSVGEKHAATLFGNIGEDEIRDISRAMANLGTVSADIVERLFEEFAQRAASDESDSSRKSAEKLLSKVMAGDRAAEKGKSGENDDGPSMWEKLANVNEQVLANFLKNEYPQTVAVVLSKIRPEHAARVFATLPEDFAMEVITRMLDMDAVQKEVVDDVEKTLRSELMLNLTVTETADAHALVADILNSLDRTTENRLMSMLQDRNREAAERIRELLLTFDDIEQIDPAGIQTLLRAVDKRQLAVALKGASDPVRDAIYDNMSERAAAILREDLLAMGPIRLREVDEAQAEIMRIVKDMIARGEVAFGGDGSKSELIY